MPQDFTVSLTDPQTEALQQLARQSGKSDDEALLSVVGEGIGKLIPTISKPIPKDRLETFIDGVFAVALTLLVVEVIKDIPSVVGDWQKWWPDLWQKLLVFVYSFWVVGIYWIAHHNELNMLNELGGPRTRMRLFLHLNLLFVLFIVFIPFSAALLGHNIMAPREIAEAAHKCDCGIIVSLFYPNCFGAETDGFWRIRFPFLVYAINLVLVSFAFQWVWSFIRSGDAGAFDRDHAGDIDKTTSRNWFLLICAGVVAILGILLPVFIIQFLLVIVPLFYTANMLYGARSSREGPLWRLIRGK